MGHVATKPVLGVSIKAILKPVSAAAETSLIIGISLVATLDMMLSEKRKIKALIRLHGCVAAQMLVIMAGIHKMLVRVASSEDTDQTASEEAV